MNDKFHLISNNYYEQGCLYVFNVYGKNICLNFITGTVE